MHFAVPKVCPNLQGALNMVQGDVAGPMKLTAYHAKLLAHELTKRSSSDDVDKLASALSDAQVDLNPHQIEAALFAFRSPLSKGAILADEVGLGKTIEAGILLAQRWAERGRRLLVICPANLRKQWSQELSDKFFLPTAILEAKTFNEAVRGGNPTRSINPRSSFALTSSPGRRSPTCVRRLGISSSSTKPIDSEMSTRRPTK